MAYLSPVLNESSYTEDGKPLAGGKIYAYQTGGGALYPMYSTGAGTVQLSNPVILDSAGQAPLIYLNENLTYRLVLQDAGGTILKTYDGITPSASSPSAGQIAYSSTGEYITGTVGYNLKEAEADITSVQGNISTIQSNVSNLTGDVTDLDTRVTTLESGAGSSGSPETVTIYDAAAVGNAFTVTRAGTTTYAGLRLLVRFNGTHETPMLRINAGTYNWVFKHPSTGGTVAAPIPSGYIGDCLYDSGEGGWRLLNPPV